MHKSDTRPSLRGAKMMTFLLGLLLLPTIIVIATPRPTYAEGLLNKVGCLVGSLLDVNCTNSSGSSPSSKTNPTPPPSSSPSSPSGASSTPTSTSSTTAKQPLLTANPTLNTPIPDAQTLAPLSPPPSAHFATTTANVVPKIGGSLLRPPYDTAAAAPIQATDQGWKVLGVLWYWWLTAIVGLVGSTMVLIARAQAASATLHKRSSLLK